MPFTFCILATAPWHKTKTFKICFQICLISIIFIAELHTGIFSNSTALIADSFHALSDVISLCIGLIAVRTANRKPKPTSRKTFGNQRSEVLGGIVQAVFLYALCFHIYTESFKRFTNPQVQHNVERIFYVGLVGFIANLTGLWMFCETGDHGHTHGESEAQKLRKSESEHSGQNLNTRGIWLHIMGDTLGSVSVIISSIVLWKYSTPAYHCELGGLEHNWYRHNITTPFPGGAKNCDQLENIKDTKPELLNSTCVKVRSKITVRHLI